MMRPYEAFLQSLPHPPPTSTLREPTFPKTTCQPLFDIRRLNSTAEIFEIVQIFTAALRNSRRERVTVPVPSRSVHNLNDYVKTFIMDRIATFFSQLQPKYISQAITVSGSPHNGHQILESISVIRCGLHCFAFQAPRARLFAYDLRSPIVVICPPSFYQQVSEPEDHAKTVSSFLDTLQIEYRTCIMFTDMQQLTIFRRTGAPSTHSNIQVVHRTLDIEGDLFRLSIIIAAHLYDGIPRAKFPITLCPAVDDNGEFESLAGPAVDHQPGIPSDYEVFARCHRHSDFDIVSILRGYDLLKGCQFLRWKAYMAHSVDPTFARVGDVITGITHGFFVGNVSYRPFYSPDPLPEITMDHIQLHRRPCDAISPSLLKSSSFSVMLLEDLTTPSRVTMCRTYRCSVSIDREDGSPLAVSSEFCIKLFEDRFLSFQWRDEDDDLTQWNPEDQMDAIRRFWDTAEDCVKREEAAYRKLSVMQGSLIPHYYGAHRFILPNKHIVYGILMEYIHGHSLRGGVCRTLSEPQQIQLVESVRHAVRVLQYSDVSQHDWHPGQVLCYSKDDGTVHGVLIDFSQTRQSYREGDTRMEDDAADGLMVLLDSRTGLDRDLVWSHWAAREPWDSMQCLIRGHIYSVPDPLKFVLTCITL